MISVSFSHSMNTNILWVKSYGILSSILTFAKSGFKHASNASNCFTSCSTSSKHGSQGGTSVQGLFCTLLWMGCLGSQVQYPCRDSTTRQIAARHENLVDLPSRATGSPNCHSCNVSNSQVQLAHGQRRSRLGSPGYCYFKYFWSTVPHPAKLPPVMPCFQPPRPCHPFSCN